MNHIETFLGTIFCSKLGKKKVPQKRPHIPGEGSEGRGQGGWWVKAVWTVSKIKDFFVMSSLRVLCSIPIYKNIYIWKYMRSCVHLKAKISSTPILNKRKFFCVLLSCKKHKMPLNSRKIFVHQNLRQIEHFYDISLVDEDTGKAFFLTVQ